MGLRKRIRIRISEAKYSSEIGRGILQAMKYGEPFKSMEEYSQDILNENLSEDVINHMLDSYNLYIKNGQKKSYSKYLSLLRGTYMIDDLVFEKQNVLEKLSSDYDYDDD